MDNNSSKQVVDVSILSANYNNGQFLHDYFQSILNSTVLPKELVFVDDCSQDNSLEVLEIFKDLEFLRIIRLNTNTGFAHALNLGIDECSAKYILRLDPDDFLNETRIESQYILLMTNQEIDLLGSNVFYFHDQKKKVISKSNMFLSHKDIEKVYKGGNHGMFHTSVVGKTSVFKRYKYRQSYYPAEDYDFFSRALNTGCKLMNQSEALTYYRIHSNNLSFVRLKDSMNKIILARQEIFHLKSSPFWLAFNYYHRYFYRRSLIATNTFSKTFCTMLALLFRLKVIFRRIKSR